MIGRAVLIRRWRLGSISDEEGGFVMGVIFPAGLETSESYYIHGGSLRQWPVARSSPSEDAAFRGRRDGFIVAKDVRASVRV